MNSILCRNGVRPGRISQRTATGTMRFLSLVTVLSRRSRKRASDELRARILMRVDSGSGWNGGSFSRFYKMFHFVDSFTGEAAFLEGRIARPRRQSLAMATFFMVQRRQAFNS